MTSSNETKTDFLEADDNIRGQNYCCLSFISPENVIKNKQLYFLNNFLKHIIKENNIQLDESYNNIEEKYKDFLYTREEALEREFNENNDFQTSVRGVKIRGVYDSLQEAQVRAKVLQTKDKNFNVYVGQVGFWLPWDPNPHNIDNQEYFESELNELVKKYKENQSAKDEHFREHVDNIKNQAASEAKLSKASNESNIQSINDSENNINIDSDFNHNSQNNLKPMDLEKEDPWIASKK